jgi:hypothetical protein
MYWSSRSNIEFVELCKNINCIPKTPLSFADKKYIAIDAKSSPRRFLTIIDCKHVSSYDALSLYRVFQGVMCHNSLD